MLSTIASKISKNKSAVIKYGSNMSWLMAEKAVRLLLGFTVGVYMARQLGPTQYGIFNYALSFVLVFSVFAAAGLDSIVVRDLVKKPQEKYKILGSSAVIKMAGFLVMFIMICGGLFFYENLAFNTKILILIIATSYVLQGFQVIDFYFQSEVRSKFIALSQMISFIIISAGRFYLAYKQYSLLYFAILEVLYSVISSFLYLYFYLKIGEKITNWKFSKTTAKQLINDSWALFLSGAIAMLYIRIDLLMIKPFLGDEPLGCYSAAVKFSELWNFIPLIFCLTVFPAIINAKKQSQSNYQKRLKLLYVIINVINLGVCFVLTFAIPLVMPLLFGDKYLGAVVVTQILVWKLILMGINGVFSRWLIVEDLQKYSVVFGGVGCALNVVLNLILIPKYGLYGVCVATLTANFISVLIMPLFFQSTRDGVKILLQSFNYSSKNTGISKKNETP